MATYAVISDMDGIKALKHEIVSSCSGRETSNKNRERQVLKGGVPDDIEREKHFPLSFS